MDKREGIERRGKKWSAQEEAEFRQSILEKYERDPLYSSAWKDGIINPALAQGARAEPLRGAERGGEGDEVRRFQDVITESRHRAKKSA